MSNPGVLIVAGCPHATVTRYRCLHLQEQLENNGVSATVQTWSEDAQSNFQHWLTCDVLILQRVPINAWLSELIEQRHATDKPVIFDVDDLIFEPELASWHRGVSNLTPHEQALYEVGVRRYLATLRQSDYVLTATPLLAEMAGRHGKPASVHRNALGREMLALADRLYMLRSVQPPRDTVVIGYGSGTPTHDIDFLEATPGLLDVLTRFPQTELWIAGPMRLPREFTVFGDRVRRFPLLSWREWFELSSQMDIVLAPLEMDNIFCRAKSEIKFVEAGAIGVPVIASQIDPFVHAIVHGENGLLANSPATWIDGLHCLINDPALRIRLGQAARQTVIERYSPAVRATELAALWPFLQKRSQSSRHAPLEEQNTQLLRPKIKMGDMESQNRPEVTDHVLAANDGANEPFTPLTINWLVTEPFVGSGGHTGIFRMIRHLVEFGHICHVYIVPVHFMHQHTPKQLEQYVSTHFMPTRAVFHLWNGEVEPADATVATYWKTVPLILQLPSPGRRYYLVQDFEPYFYPMGSEYIQAEYTYRQGLHCLTLGPWLARLMREQYGATADHFDFAVDTDIYLPIKAPRPAHPRVAFYARPSTPRRAYELGIEALALVKQRNPDVEIVLYGAEELTPPPTFPVTNMGILNPWELARLFSSCDIGLVCSTTNPSFVPFEMMACRCAVVDLRSERVADLLEDGVNCRLADPTPQSIAETLLEFLHDKRRREEIVERAYTQVSALSWRQSARQIEAVLLRHAPPSAQRIVSMQARNDDTELLAWQIHQLLDAGAKNFALVDELRAVLYQTLAEKAALLQHIQELEHSYKGRQNVTEGRRLQQFVTKTTANIPFWRLGKTPVSKLLLDQTPYHQRFRADRSHLCRIEILFATQYPLHTGTITVKLHDDQEQPIAIHTARVVDIHFDVPFVLDFPAQENSFERYYVLSISAGEIGQQSPALWRLQQPKFSDATLQHGDQPIEGQIAFQPYFCANSRKQPPRQELVDWGKPPQLAPIFTRQAIVRPAREVGRLTSRTLDTLRTNGLGGLTREIGNYLEWQLKKSRSQPE